MKRVLVIEVEDTGLGDPLTADREGKPVELFIGSFAFQVSALREEEPT
jgi:hypothetical protein